MSGERIQKMLARAGVASRRGADQLVADGRVTVNGRIAEVGERVDPAQDRIEVDGQPVGAALPTVHYAVHKPRGLLSSSRDERGRRSVVHLVPTQDGTRLWPAGRLDAESEGLMLLTNDGEWANRVLHPSRGIEREYAVLLDRPPSPAAVRRLRNGVELEDGPARLLSASPGEPPVEVELATDEDGPWLTVRIGEGRKREVRRLFDVVGHDVRRLVRTAIGPLSLSGLRAGEWRPLRDAEVAALAGNRATAHRPEGALTVSIDGPSGAGKSTVGHALAQRIGATFVDTGLMYRALTLAALDRDLDLEDGPGLGRLADAVRIDVRRPRRDQPDRLETVLLDGLDVTDDVRTTRIDRAVSAVSRHGEVRDAMLEVQRRAAKHGATVMVGRDIGTVVVPHARPKVYLTATQEIRARRRADEMGEPDRFDDYLAEMRRRDEIDSTRARAPLTIPEGALVLDTGECDVEACVDAIVDRIEQEARR